MNPWRVLRDAIAFLVMLALLLLFACAVAVLVHADPRIPEGVPVPARVAEGWGRVALRIEEAPKIVPEPNGGYLGAYGGAGGCAGPSPIHDLIVAQPWDDSYALYVAGRESGCLATAYNATPWPPGSDCHASGVFQILTGGRTCDNWWRWSTSCGFAGASVFDAYANVKVAACIVARYGWGPWAL